MSGSIPTSLRLQPQLGHPTRIKTSDPLVRWLQQSALSPNAGLEQADYMLTMISARPGRDLAFSAKKSKNAHAQLLQKSSTVSDTEGKSPGTAAMSPSWVFSQRLLNKRSAQGQHRGDPVERKAHQFPLPVGARVFVGKQRLRVHGNHSSLSWANTCIPIHLGGLVGSVGSAKDVLIMNRHLYSAAS